MGKMDEQDNKIQLKWSITTLNFRAICIIREVFRIFEDLILFTIFFSETGWALWIVSKYPSLSLVISTLKLVNYVKTTEVN